MYYYDLVAWTSSFESSISVKYVRRGHNLNENQIGHALNTWECGLECHIYLI